MSKLRYLNQDNEYEELASLQDLENSIPTKVSELTNDSGFLAGSDVKNNVTSTDTNKPLSANMGKELQDQIDNLKSRGRYLSQWNAVTGLPTTNPTTSPYAYHTGDYFIVETVGTTNYKPSGSSYTIGVASTTVETNDVTEGDSYYYDGTSWNLQVNTQKTVSFSNLSGSPSDNSNLASALNAKQATISDLATIRSGAAAGATAVQPGANISGFTNDSGYITLSGVPKELPAVTSSDNGAFLRVVDGEWSKSTIASAEGGSF